MNRRFLCAVGAALVALALVVGGVFAWADNSQHKSNVVTGNNLLDRPDVVLVEKFEEPEDPKPGQEIEKEITIKNTGDSQLFVRLQLKEYMEISKITYSYTEEFLLVDTDGKFMQSTGISAADRVSFKAGLDAMGLVYEDSQIVAYRAYGETVDRFYLATSATTNINGKYGKRLMLDYDQADPHSLVEGVVRGGYEETIDHRLHPTSECLYTPHLWNDPPPELNNCGQGDYSELYDGTGLGFHDYFEWKLGTQLIKLSDWDGQPTAAWILDDAGDEGWAYWGQALRSGEETAKLLESITLLQRPDGPYYYAIHVDMQVVDWYVDFFDNVPNLISDSYNGDVGFVIKANRQSFNREGSEGYIKFTAYWDGAAIPAGDVDWSVTGLTVSLLGPYTRFAAIDGTPTPGNLTIGGGQPEGKLLVAAAYDSPDGVKTQQYVITVR